MPSTEKAPKPQTVVAGDTFIWNSTDPDVGEVRVPLKFKGKILKAAKSMQDDELGFMFFVLEQIGVPDAVTDEMDAAELRSMFAAWQLAWQERAEATLGESSSSSS